MGINNIGKLFYKDYYKEVNFENVINGIESSPGQINQKIKRSAHLTIANPIGTEECSSFRAKILYPGLVTGVGLEHNSKNIKGGYNLGMHFDYTWGMPVVYGSSVKGVLREYFKEFYEGEIDKQKLEEDIFSGKVENENKSIYDRDIFFDAVITKPYESNNKKHLLEDDSITPHKDGPLRNPLPITMLKIAPGCKMEFRFKLNNHKIKDREYTSDFILEIFKNILGTVGVGAKTNVGYGQLKIEK
jgi:CRISPR-associated protein Cmr6